MNMTQELDKEFGFDNIEIIKPVLVKTRKNKKANGVHKYLKDYLKLYNWKDREDLIKRYTFDKINPETGKVIDKMKQRYNYIQADFNAFVDYLKKNKKK